MPAIEIRSLTKDYKKFWRPRPIRALDGLDLKVPEKQIFGFLGPNGAGKTTTIRLLLGLIFPTEGSATVLGKPIGDLDAKRRVGFLSEHPCFDTHLSGFNVLKYYGKLSGVDRKALTNRIMELVELVGLKGREQDRLTSYSRGMLQRIGIAQALINNPDLVILDEPITGLDPVGRHEIRDLITHIRDQGKTVFFSSHVLADVEQMCDYIGIIKEGKLIEEGPLDNILKTREISISAENVSDETRKQIESVALRTSVQEGRLEAVTPSPEKMEEIKSMLQSSDATDIKVEKWREPLEDYFLQRMKN